jgi:hypothetical protein
MPDEKTGQSGALPRSFAHQFVTLFFAKLWWLILCVFHFLFRVLVVFLGMVGGATAALFAARLLFGDKSWGMIPAGVIAALLLIAFAIFLRRICRMSLWVMVTALILVECMVLSSICGDQYRQDRLDVLDPFNLQWLAFMNLSIGLPWVLGMVIGNIWLKRSARRQPVRVCVIQR